MKNKSNKRKYLSLKDYYVMKILTGIGLLSLAVAIILLSLWVGTSIMSEQLDPNTTYEGLEGSSNNDIVFRGAGYDCSRKGTYSVTSLLFTLKGNQSFIDDIWVDRKAFAISDLSNKRREFYGSSEIFPMFMEISVPCTNIVVNRTYASYKDFPEDDDCIDDEGRYCFVKYRKIYTDWSSPIYFSNNNSNPIKFSANTSMWRIE